MKSYRSSLLSGTVVPLVVGAGVALGGATLAKSPNAAAKPKPAVLKQVAACNPCAAKKGCNPCAAKGCNPCAAKKGCNPCAAKGCNPCAAKKGCNPCGACNPCGGAASAAVSKRCFIKRLQAANPCAAKKGCNPCSAKKGCNPCAAKGCNPCAAKGCNPCAAKKGCNPCGAKKTACNPCAAKKGCNPCAAKKGCNPCAAKKGCNPCAAKKGCNPCGPCNPCGASEAVEITPCEAKAAYRCLRSEMVAAYSKSGHPVAKWYAKYRQFNKHAYVSATHGARYVNNYGNRTARRKYGRYEKAGTMPHGSVLAKDSFVVQKDGKLAIGPLFIMTKMKDGFNKASANWQYAMIMPDGKIFGVTDGKNSAGVKFCITCHAGAEVDQMMFLPDEVRRK